MMLSAKKLELRGTVLVSERRGENAALNETALSQVERERYRCVLHRVRARGENCYALFPRLFISLAVSLRA